MKSLALSIVLDEEALFFNRLEYSEVGATAPDGSPLVFLALAHGRWRMAQALVDKGHSLREVSPAGQGAWSALLGGGSAQDPGWDLVLAHGPSLAWREPGTDHDALHLLAAHCPSQQAWIAQALAAGCSWNRRAQGGARAWDLLPPPARAAYLESRWPEAEPRAWVRL